MEWIGCGGLGLGIIFGVGILCCGCCWLGCGGSIGR